MKQYRNFVVTYMHISTREVEFVHSWLNFEQIDEFILLSAFAKQGLEWQMEV